ncbi:MAG: outer membrane protein assembly factor BamA [Gemmatimonadaceae bacterium]
MRKLSVAALAFLCVCPSLRAQEGGAERSCATPDSIAIMGNKRVASTTILLDAGLTPGTPLNAPMVQRAIKNVFAGGQFDAVNIECVLSKTTPVKATILIRVVERPLLEATDVVGTSAISASTVKEKVDLVFGRPIDPSAVALVIQHIDSIYQASGYYLARIAAETTYSDSAHASIIFHIDEGSRLAVSGVRVSGNKFVPTTDIVGTMKVKPEGFFFWQKGEFDQENYSKDLGELIPQMYASRGYVDFQIQKDTLIVDRTRGKGLIDLSVSEGPQYKVGSFEVVGNRRFTAQDIARMYPFTDQSPSLTERLSALIKGKQTPKDVFNATKWDDATRQIKDAYANQGYIYSQVRPVVDKVQTDSGPRANLRWEVQEGTPAIINRIEIIGNDYTTETCIRDQLSIIPGDVFSQDRLINSYRSIENLGFFESPLPLPETRQADDQGDVDIIFKVKEKRTGNVNFGASLGQGTGLGGFIGLDQPNMFGKCKRGSINWQYGEFINDLQLSYTDPSLFQTRTSMTDNLYRSESQYTIANLGQSTRTGGSLLFTFPFFGAHYTRLGLSYGVEAVRYGGTGLLSEVTTNDCAGCLRSTVGVSLTRDTRIEMPFPTDGSLQTVTAQFNGGPLGGTASFQQYRTEFKTYATLAKLGGDKSGPNGMKIVVGLTERGGMVMGSTGPFFSTQEFALGGVQYGEPLRGYPEFSITPFGYNPNTSESNAVLQSFGNVFFTSTAELGLRISSQFYVNLFYDAGNLWAHPRDFDPTRLFRGAGIGVGTVTPLGPLGLDWAYGFDRTDALGNPDPKFMIHFRLGQIFY